MTYLKLWFLAPFSLSSFLPQRQPLSARARPVADVLATFAAGGDGLRQTYRLRDEDLQSLRPSVHDAFLTHHGTEWRQTDCALQRREIGSGSVIVSESELVRVGA